MHCLSPSAQTVMCMTSYLHSTPLHAVQVDRRRGDLFNYIIFLRVTPILPNIFINIASPVVDVPLQSFAMGERIAAACSASCPLCDVQYLVSGYRAFPLGTMEWCPCHVFAMHYAQLSDHYSLCQTQGCYAEIGV